MCPHGIARLNCSECTTTAYKLESGAWCLICVETRLSQRKMASGVYVCSKCDPTQPKRIETVVYEQLGELWQLMYNEPLPMPTMRDTQVIGCNGDKRRPDLCWVWSDRVVHLEVDEHSHSSREVSCETAKLDQTNFGTAGKHRATLFIRFNPDNPDFVNALKLVCTLLRTAFQAEDMARDLNLCPTRANVQFIAYSAAGAKHIKAAAEQPLTIKVIHPTSE
jgi:hypothetical protein